MKYLLPRKWLLLLSSQPKHLLQLRHTKILRELLRVELFLPDLSNSKVQQLEVPVQVIYQVLLWEEDLQSN